ncbi:MAG TPA: hypothetical protein VJ820_00410 [Propionibacteriaceae bacterium]|nr:hypothetical protein [Propionibacteriaceae bacterium]
MANDAAPIDWSGRTGRTWKDEIRGLEIGAAMAACEVCGNDYEMSFEVVTAGVTHTFDSFECAIHALAPVCEHCGCKVIGHGTQVQGRFYCCAHCAREKEGTDAVSDHA